MKPVNIFTWKWLALILASYTVIGFLTNEQPLTTRTVTIPIVSGITTFFVLLFLFGWLPAKLLGFNAIPDEELMIDLQEGEGIRFQGPANHRKGIESVGGKIYLTNQRLYFRSHKWNFQNHSLSIPLAQIENLEEHLPPLAVKKQLIVKWHTNKREKFVLQHHAAFSQKLERPLIAV